MTLPIFDRGETYFGIKYVEMAKVLPFDLFLMRTGRKQINSRLYEWLDIIGKLIARIKENPDNMSTIRQYQEMLLKFNSEAQRNNLTQHEISSLFNMVEYVANIKISPAQDTWTRTITIDGGERVTTVPGRRNRRVLTSISTILESREPDNHIRSRNVQFNASTLKPLARYYHFFDSSSDLDIIPKLTEITMSSGSEFSLIHSPACFTSK